MTTRFRLGGAAALVAAVVLAGCQSENPNAPARVSGRVTYNGAPVTGGSVTFHYKSGGTISAPISADGSYEAFDIPTGEAAISIETESVNPDKPQGEYRGTAGGGAAGKYMKGGGAAAPLKPKGKGMQQSPAPEGAGSGVTYMKIPPKYADPAASGLTITVEKGKQTKDIELAG